VTVDSRLTAGDVAQTSAEGACDENLSGSRAPAGSADAFLPVRDMGRSWVVQLGRYMGTVRFAKPPERPSVRTETQHSMTQQACQWVWCEVNSLTFRSSSDSASWQLVLRSLYVYEVC
jgi:hypothetical protein